jgi:PAS domain S-box-containing protein
MQRLLDFVPSPADLQHPSRSVIANGISILMPECTDEDLRSIALSPQHHAFLRKDLHPRSLLCTPIAADGDKVGVITFIRDTIALPFNDLDRIAAEELGARLGLALRYSRIREELRLQRARLDAILESVPVGVLVADNNGRILMGNAELDRIFRHPLQHSPSIDHYSERFAMHSNGTRLRSEEYPMARTLITGATTRGEEYLYQRGDGTRAWISISAAPVVDTEGERLGGIVAVADIDEQKKARELMRRSEERFRMLIERASVGINIGDEHGNLIYVNPALLKLIGYTEEEVRRGEVRWDRLTPPKYAKADRTALDQLKKTGVAQTYEKSYIAKDGTLVPMLLGAAMIPSLDVEDDAQDLAVFFTDLTMQKKAEAALIQAEKLAAVGKLASSISHEINNPLEAVTNLLFIVRNDPNLSQQSKDYLGTAERELARVAQVTSHTLRFHRQSTSAMTIQPDHLVEEVLGLYNTRLASSGVSVIRDYSPGVQVTCYEGDIRQVMNNLVANAFDAMRGSGGRLTIRTSNATRWSTGEPGVRITIADTGTGISPETLGNIFDAFYTTKGIAGTGLGLWISSRIVHKHRGYIKTYSSQRLNRHGTVFVLWLPLRLADSANEAWHMEDGLPV